MSLAKRRAALLAELARLVSAQGAVLAELAALEGEQDGVAARPCPGKRQRVPPLRVTIDPSIEVSELAAARAEKALRRYRR